MQVLSILCWVFLSDKYITIVELYYVPTLLPFSGKPNETKCAKAVTFNITVDSSMCE